MRRMHEACFALLTLMCSVVLSRAVFADDSVVDEIGIGVPISCTLSGTGMSSHTATIPNGIYSGSYTADGVDYTDGIGSTTLKAMCNDNEGFAIYAAGYTGDEIGGTNSTNLVGTSASGNSIIATGTATGPVGGDDVSNWAMKLNTVTSPAPTYPITIDGGFSSYSAVPSSYTKVAHRDSATDVGPNGVGSTLTTTYAAYISKNQPADTYSGKVIYTLVHPSNETPLQPIPTESGKICYYPNGSNVEGTMGCQTIPESGTADDVSPTSAILLASNFSREGYGFAGWSKTYDYSDSSGFLGPQEYIEFTEEAYSGNNNGLSLYAHWVESDGDLQNWSGCSGLASGAVTALTDQRDNETYAVAKLADGNCWMIENLRLESTAEHNSDGALAQGYGTSATYGNFGGLATAESTNFSNSTTANSLYSQSASGNKIVIGANDYPYARMPRYNNLNTPADASNRPQNPTSNTFSSDNTTVGMYSYGNYYTWAAAMANTIYYKSPTARDADGKTSETVNTSLCPIGWRLPYGRDTNNGAISGGFSYLDIQLGGTGTSQYTAEASHKWRAYPSNFIYSGYFGAKSAFSRGIYGEYWSSTADDDRSSYNLGLMNILTNPGTDNHNKNYGLSIRCITPAS